MEELYAGGLMEFSPEVADVDVHDVALRIEVHVPDLLQELGPPNNLFWAEEEML